MFIGHFAIGFASKPLAPRSSLGVLIAAPMFLDILWPIFVALGIEHVRIAPGITKVVPLDLYDYPWSHSLVMAAVWSLVFGVLYYGLGNEGRAGVITGFGVMTHWVLDYVTHRPDMLLYPKGHVHYGLGLWNNLRATLAIEGAMFGVAVLIYFFTTRARDWIGHVFWLFVVFLVAAYAGSIFAPPPPSLTALLATAFGGFVLFPWAGWFDKHRVSLRDKTREEAD